MITYLVILLLVMTAYRINRAAHIKRLQTDLTRITAEQNSTRTVENELTGLSRLIPAEAKSPEFIETLFIIARESGLKQHEASTEAAKSSGTPRPGGSDTTASMSRQIIKIHAVGSYRNFAEYVRRLQNLERKCRITDFTLSPDIGQLKGTLTVELYFLPGKL